MTEPPNKEVKHLVDFLRILIRHVEIASLHGFGKAKTLLIIDLLGIHVRFGPHQGNATSSREICCQAVFVRLNGIESCLGRRAEYQYHGMALGEFSRLPFRVNNFQLNRRGIDGNGCPRNLSFRSFFRSHNSVPEKLHPTSISSTPRQRHLTSWMSVVLPAPLSPTTATQNFFGAPSISREIMETAVCCHQ